MPPRQLRERVVEVGLMALHDREFFELLLDDPRAAVTRFAREQREPLDEELVRKVSELVERRGPTLTREAAFEAWDRYHESGRLRGWMDKWYG